MNRGNLSTSKLESQIRLLNRPSKRCHIFTVDWNRPGHIAIFHRSESEHQELGGQE